MTRGHLRLVEEGYGKAVPDEIVFANGRVEETFRCADHGPNAVLGSPAGPEGEGGERAGAGLCAAWPRSV